MTRTLICVVLIAVFGAWAHAQAPADAQVAAPAESKAKPKPKRNRSAASRKKRQNRRWDRDAEGTEALGRFEADTVIKSHYQLNGEPLEVDPD